MTPVNSYLTQREREMQISQAHTATSANNVVRGGLVQRLVRAFGSRETRNHQTHASMPPRIIGKNQTVAGEVI